MYIKRYTIASFVLIALVGGYVYSYVTQGTNSIELFGIALPSLPTAIWVMVPLVLLYVTSVLHMSFYSILASFKLRKYNKDYDKVIDAIVDAYLAKAERSHIYNTSRYKLLGSIIDSTRLFPTEALRADTENEKLDAVIRVVENIRNGEVEDLKKYSLKSTNALVIQNEKNRYKKGDISAENILKHSANYDVGLVKDIYTDFVKTASVNAIEQYKSLLSKESLYIILSRVNADENSLEISNEVLISFLDILELDAKDLVQISTTLSTGMIPEQRMKLFETLSENSEDAVEAYLYTLFDLEMLAPAKEFLDNTQNDEYVNFKAYMALKECGNNYNINMFV